MAALSRRTFLATTAALAAAAGLERVELGSALSLVPAADTDARTTLASTILHGPVVTGRYRRLTTGPGEAYLPRYDVLRRAGDPARTSRRRSLLYLGHLSDLHVIDAQSPGRIEPMIVQDHASWASAFHPQDPLSAHTTSAMVTAFSDAAAQPPHRRPDGGRGRHRRQRRHALLRSSCAGTSTSSTARPCDPASSGASYQGVQAWPEATWAYRPG